MAWTNPIVWVANQIVTAAQLNTYIKDNLNELRSGGIAMSSQVQHDFLYASSATQLGRLGVGGGLAGRVPTFISPNWVLASMWPVGSIYENASDSTSPATLFGFGTWSALAPGRVLVAIDAGQTEFDTIGETGGEKTHTLTTAEIPGHVHNTNVFTQTGSGGAPGLQANTAQASEVATDANTGGGGAHENMPPYLVIYRWVRTS